MACVDDGFSGNHYFEKRIWKEVKKGYCHFQNGDIGIAKISPCFENLKSTIFQGLPNNCGAGTTELVILRPINIYAKFYLYLFKSQWYIDEGTKYFKGVVGQQRVHKGIFTDLHIPLPPLVEQQRIVTEIEKWFALIDQIEQGKVNLQTTIKQIKSKILDLAIHGKLVPQDPNDEPSIELLQRINPDFTPCDNGHYQMCIRDRALALCNDFDNKGISLDTLVNINRDKLDPKTWSPMLKDYSGPVISLTVRDLLRYTLTQSDNNASNLMFKDMVNVAQTDSFIATLIPRSSFQIAYTEEEMSADHNKAYSNYTSPLGAAMLMNRLFTEGLIDDEKQSFIKNTLKECKTGVDRIAAPLLDKEGVVIAHKTGSGDVNENGVLAAHNDVAYICPVSYTHLDVYKRQL